MLTSQPDLKEKTIGMAPNDTDSVAKLIALVVNNFDKVHKLWNSFNPNGITSKPEESSK